ncbi:orotidine-5'-phosphate decarboxylase [Caloramator quimbayensis]|uniref:Orotidine 5'-phosphate decarboxylase n=1 Tax=Caloramator quimbayensis TaxID=1147123 RepID=A0A1T4X6J9_9CLOT|nr:orotidine-5'-phosphate decarboxylase [Caloramator quimbayensis]SKA85037.1 orotidine-5'-phosphate decarboxylase [Caloramator quimbayensis]
MIIDNLYESVKNKSCICVGLDTSIDYIPYNLKKGCSSILDAVFNFNKKIIDATYDLVSCYKVQIAYYEALGIEGLCAYMKTLKYIKSKGGISIGDIKRGDISSTAKMYAKAHFEGDFECDFITLSPYMGFDSIEPYLEYVENKNKGLFVLLRTSNEGAKDIQYIESKDNKKVFNYVGDRLYEISKDYKGKYGYSSIGAVVGCTHNKESMDIRKSYKNMFFLIPGYGAQGGSASDVALYLNNGNGGVVNSSRAILLAYKNYENGDIRFDECARLEVLKMKGEIENAVKL